MKLFIQQICLGATVLTLCSGAMAYSSQSASGLIKNDYDVIQAYNKLVPRGTWEMKITKLSDASNYDLNCNGSEICPTEIKDGEQISFNMTQSKKPQVNLSGANGIVDLSKLVSITLKSPKYKSPYPDADYCVDVISYDIFVSINPILVDFAIGQSDIKKFSPYLWTDEFRHYECHPIKA